MNRNNKTSSLTEAAVITGILVIISYLSTLIPIIVFFYPTPVIILAKRKGIKYAALSLLAACAIITILQGISIGITYFILYSPFSLALAYGVYRDEDANKTILYGSAAYMTSFVVLILLLNTVMGVNFVEQLKTMSQEGYNLMEQMLFNIPEGFNSERIEETLKMVEDYRTVSDFLLSNLFPALIITTSVISSYINYLVARRFARRFSITIKKHEGLSLFTFPRTFMVAMAGMLLVSYLLGMLKFNVGVIQLNLFYIIFIAMVIQGLAVIKFFLEKRFLNRSVQVLIIFMLLYMAFLFAGVINIIVITGLLDLAINLRKLNRAV